MKSRPLAITAAILFIGSGNLAFAGSGSGKVNITSVGMFGGVPSALFKTSVRQNIPGQCKQDGRFMINIGTDLGKAQYAILLTAQASGKDVIVDGTSDCPGSPNIEFVNWVGYK